MTKSPARVVLYRGTTLRKARALTRGTDRSGALWFTDELAIARMYAKTGAGRELKPEERRRGGAVVAVDAKPSELYADLRAYAILNKVRRWMGRRPIPFPDERDWRTSLGEMGSVMLITRLVPGEARIIERTGWARVGRFVDPQRRPYSATLQMLGSGYDDVVRAIRPVRRQTKARSS